MPLLLVPLLLVPLLLVPLLVHRRVVCRILGLLPTLRLQQLVRWRP